MRKYETLSLINLQRLLNNAKTQEQINEVVQEIAIRIYVPNEEVTLEELLESLGYRYIPKYRAYLDSKSLINGTIEDVHNVLDKYILEEEIKGTYLVVEDNDKYDNTIYMGFGDKESYLEFKKPKTKIKK